MKEPTYAEQMRRFWRGLRRFGLVLLALGALATIFGLDLYVQRGTALGRVVGHSRGGSYVSPRSGGERFVDTSRYTVAYVVEGRTWTIGVPEWDLGDPVRINYYRRWPQLARLTPLHTWPLSVGGVLLACGAASLIVWRIRGRGR